MLFRSRSGDELRRYQTGSASGDGACSVGASVLFFLCAAGYRIAVDACCYSLPLVPLRGTSVLLHFRNDLGCKLAFDAALVQLPDRGLADDGVDGERENIFTYRGRGFRLPDGTLRGDDRRLRGTQTG